MNLLKKITALSICAAAMTTTSLQLILTNRVPVSAAYDDTQDDWLTTDGNKIVDMYGN